MSSTRKTYLTSPKFRAKLKKIMPYWPVSILLTFFLTGNYGLDRPSHAIYGASSIFLAIFFTMDILALKSRKWGLEDYALITFGALLLLSTFTRMSPEGDQELMGYGAGILVYFTLSHLKKSALQKKGVIAVLGLSLALSLYGLYDFITGPTSRLTSIFYGEEIFHTYPNVMAAFLLVMIPLHLWLSPHLKTKRSVKKPLTFKQLSPTFIWTASLSIHLSALWLTLSRGSVLALIVAALFALILKGLKPLKWIVCSVLLSLLIAIPLNNSNEYKLAALDRFQGEDVSSSQSVDERFEFWEGAMEITLDHPLLGTGPGSFEFIYPEYQDHLLVLSDHPHNILLKFSSENGIFAALAFLLFLSILAIKVLSSLKELKPERRQKQIALGLIVIALMAQSMVDYNLNFTIISFLFFATLGILQSRLPIEPHLLLEAPSEEKEAFFEPLTKKQLASLTLFFLLVSVGSLIRGAHGLYNEFYPPDVPAYEQIQRYPDIYSSHFACALADYQSGQTESEYIDSLLQKNSLNDFSFHWLYLMDDSYSENFSLESSAKTYKAMLEHYQESLALNMHQTAITPSPEAASRIYEWFLEQELNEDTRLSWEEEQETFISIWQLELDKFNSRFGSKFSQSTFDSALDSLLVYNPEITPCGKQQRSTQ